MKPSTRIKEIQQAIYDSHEKGCINHGYEPCGVSIGSCKSLAIQDYLDEEYEKNKPCEHLETEKFHHYDGCKKCGALGMFKPLSD